MPFSIRQSDKTKKTKRKSLQAQQKTGSKSTICFFHLFHFFNRKRASASACQSGVRGSMSVEAALVMSFFLLSVNLLFYFFYLMKFQVELQFLLEQKVHEAAAGQQERLPAGLRTSIDRELFGEGTGPFLRGTGLRLVENRGEEEAFLDVTAAFEAGPVFLPFGPMKGTYLHRCRRRIWNGKDFIREGGAEGEDTEQEYVYITQNGTVYHRSRDCTYLRPSVRSVSSESLSGLRSSDGSKYYSCERCMKGAQTPQTVYLTTYGNRYHSSKNCSSLNRWVMKISLEEAGARTPCSKCGGG